MSSTAAAHAPTGATTDGIGFFDAAKLVKRTGSYTRERAVVLVGLSGVLAGALVATILVTGALSFLSKAAAGVVFLVAVLAAVFLLMPYIDRKFFSMRAAFAFLITEVIVRGSGPQAGSPTERAKAFLTERFGDLGPVCDAHQDVRRIVTSFFRTFDKIDELLPIDLGPVRRALAFLVDRIAPRVADLAISFAVARGDRDFAEASKDAVALVAQNPKTLLSTAIRAYVTERIIGGTVGFIAMSVSFTAVFLIVNALAGDAAATSGQRVDPAMRARIASAAGDMNQAGKLAGLFD